MKILSLFPPLLALTLLCAGCGSPPAEGAKVVADQFVRTLMAEDYGSAYRDASMNFRTRTRFEEFSSDAGKLKAAPGSSVTWSEPVEETDQIRLSGTVPRVQGAPARIDLSLMREIDQWKVSRFSVE